MSENSQYVDTRELAKLTGVSASTWNKRRLTGDTPPFVKIGRSVRYHVPVVVAWLAHHQRSSTSDSYRRPLRAPTSKNSRGKDDNDSLLHGGREIAL
jgi:predicted DNA-binding transcriptional regulator AlpA